MYNNIMNAIGPITQMNTKNKCDKPYRKKLLSALGLKEEDVKDDKQR